MFNLGLMNKLILDYTLSVLDKESEVFRKASFTNITVVVGICVIYIKPIYIEIILN